MNDGKNLNEPKSHHSTNHIIHISFSQKPHSLNQILKGLSSFVEKITLSAKP